MTPYKQKRIHVSVKRPVPHSKIVKAIENVGLKINVPKNGKLVRKEVLETFFKKQIPPEYRPGVAYEINQQVGKKVVSLILKEMEIKPKD